MYVLFEGQRFYTWNWTRCTSTNGNRLDTTAVMDKPNILLLHIMVSVCDRHSEKLYYGFEVCVYLSSTNRNNVLVVQVFSCMLCFEEIERRLITAKSKPKAHREIRKLYAGRLEGNFRQNEKNDQMTSRNPRTTNKLSITEQRLRW